MRTIRIPKPLPLLVISALAIVPLGGCLTAQNNANSMAEAESMFPRNREIWALPLDSFMFRASNLMTRAEQLLESKCMKHAGFDNYPFAEINLDAPPSKSKNPGGIRIFNEKLAQKWGYREAPSKQYNPAKFKLNIQKFRESASKAELSTLEKCVVEVSKTIDGGVNLSSLQIAAGLGASDAAYSDQAVQVAVKEWSKCMKPLGLPNLPATPREMSVTFTTEETGDGSETSLDSDDLAYLGKVPAKEIQIATADARCRESSGYAAALYEAQYQEELKAYVEHEDELQRVKKANQDYEAHLKKIVAENS